MLLKFKALQLTYKPVKIFEWNFQKSVLIEFYKEWLGRGWAWYQFLPCAMPSFKKNLLKWLIFSLTVNDASREWIPGNSREISALSFPGMLYQFPGNSGKDKMLFLFDENGKNCLWKNIYSLNLILNSVARYIMVERCNDLKTGSPPVTPPPVT